jgi:hypothetical protein
VRLFTSWSLLPALAVQAAAVVALAVGCGSRSYLYVAAASADAAPEATSCVPATCSVLGAKCGEVPDGCGASIQCGVCPEEFCGGGGAPNTCGLNDCTPRTCAGMGAECGIVSDGCSMVLDCGACPAGLACTQGQCG